MGSVKEKVFRVGRENDFIVTWSKKISLFIFSLSSVLFFRSLQLHIHIPGLLDNSTKHRCVVNLSLQ